MTKYYLGLDCGTNSVGWAATDENYNLLKKNGKSEWGMRLFDTAKTAADRRIFRSGRRRQERAKTRLKLLRRLFRDEMIKVDPEFYQRLHESFFYVDDKHLTKNSKNTLFNDQNFTDKDYYKLYPTIWHLRRAIIHAEPNEHFDLRLYFLAIQHILKHRGHFLVDGSFSQNDGDFQGLYDAFVDIAENYGYVLNRDEAEKVKEIVCDKTKGKRDKKNALKTLWEDYLIDGDLENEDSKGDLLSLAGLLVGSSVKLEKIFDGLEESVKCDFSGSDFDGERVEIEEAIGSDGLELVLAAKQIYDFGLLHNLLGEHKFISDAMVANYEQHKKDLKELKAVFKPHVEIYQKLFKVRDESEPESYAVYVGMARSSKGDRKKSIKPISQEKFNQRLKKLLEKINYEGELLERAERGELLPKQRGQAKGTIPQQVHHQELELILKRLEKDFPSFAEEDPNEKSEAKTKSQKISKIHSFRIPYYVGPLVKRKYNADGELVRGGKSQFSWADHEIAQLVYPWNFDDLVDKDERASNFIRRMTNECTYLVGEPVLPKASLSYQRYMVLNELNNLKLEGRRIDNELKQAIFNEGFVDNTLGKNITLKRLAKWLHENFPETREQELSGTSETKFLPQLSTFHEFRKILGSDFERHYSREQLDDAVEAITILSEEKSMLRHKLAKILKLDENSEEIKNLAKLSCKDWGRFSNKFLNGIRAKVDGRNVTILEALWETNANLMELLGGEYEFRKAIDDFNSYRIPNSLGVTYQDVEALYCSPSVKRSIWQTLKIVDEVVRINHQVPTKIFLEVTRGENSKLNKGYTIARKKELETKLKAIKSSDARAVLKELSGQEERALQSKRLFLYFSQMGRCAYCGKPINLEELNNWQLYDIDHIYPRSRTKDDSITRNLVLVHAEENRDKTNNYPVAAEIRNEMAGIWASWYRMGLITREKYERLIRSTPLTTEELGGFIARQIVETSQSVKAIRDLLQRAYLGTKIVMVKAGQVSDLRHWLGYDKKDKDGNVVTLGRPEFIKVRELNDLHHAKDAYLNIVVGNVMNSTFTDDPEEWVRKRENQNYTISTNRIFREERRYKNSHGEVTTWPDVEGWDFANSIEIMSKTMKQNDVLWTRMSYIESGQLYDLQIVGRGDKTDGILPIKQRKRLDPKKYGGYNSIKGAHFALIETVDKKGNVERSIVAIPSYILQGSKKIDEKAYDRIAKYIASEYSNAKIIIPCIKIKSRFEINGVPMHIAGRTGRQLIFQHGLQLILPESYNVALKKIVNLIKKDKAAKGKYEIDEAKDGLDNEIVGGLFNEIVQSIKDYRLVPGLKNLVDKILENEAVFNELTLKQKCKNIVELLKLASCGAEKGDLSDFVPSADYAQRTSRKIDSLQSIKLIDQSVTGFFEKEIDLKAIKPKKFKGKKGKK